jgi:EAL domain-containing protein (putative c-di-GMP-specific phosphodiesterase class I)/CheY-like chemotaxis protein
MQPRSVLLVEDSRVQRDQVAAMFQALGVATVHHADHGADALALLNTLPEPPDLMVIDLEMPTMDGVELIERLHRRRSRIPFIVVSSREAALVQSVETMARLQGQPVLLGLNKPLTDAALRHALAGAAPARPARRATAAGGRACALTPALLARAIADGGIVAHYQPKVCARSGVIRGVEVLARWPDPALGRPTPDRFIPLAEAEGQIHALTMAIARQAFRQAAHWNARGLVLSVAVNLSPRLLERPALVDELAQLAHEHGLAPQQVVLELTEGSIAAAQATALAVLARLRLKGFGLSIDDYGTGFSSLQRLAQVPWTELKIDRSFVHGAHDHPHQRAILQAAIEMASRLALVSVAEGVESPADWQLLQDAGCSVGQGWLFGRAMPGDELPGWLKDNAARLAGLRRPSQPVPEHAAVAAGGAPGIAAEPVLQRLLP